MSNGVLSCPICESLDCATFYQEDGRDIVRCRGCGLVFAWPMAAAESKPTQLSTWALKYAQARASGGYLDTHEARDPIFRKFFSTEPVSSAKGSVLDVGCADGHFLIRAKEAGWEPLGIDFSEDAIGLTRSRGIPAHVGGLTCTEVCRKRFDLITMWDVLEHLADPVEMLGQARKLLAPDGAVFLRVPNLPYLMLKYRIWTQCLGHAKCFIPLVHWYNYNRSTLGMVCRNAGLTRLNWRVGEAEVYGSSLRRAAQKSFHALAKLLGPGSAMCFSLEVFAYADQDKA